MCKKNNTRFNSPSTIIFLFLFFFWSGSSLSRPNFFISKLSKNLEKIQDYFSTFLLHQIVF